MPASKRPPKAASTKAKQQVTPPPPPAPKPVAKPGPPAKQHGTKVTYHEEYVDNHESVVIPHAEGGAVTFLGGEFGGGGGDHRWTIKYVVTEPATDDDFKAAQPVGKHLSRVPRAA